jgi:hypothetical protein
MPSTSPAQARLMAAVAHGWHKPGGGGPPVSVAREFNQADEAQGARHSAPRGKQRSTQRSLTKALRRKGPDGDADRDTVGQV